MLNEINSGEQLTPSSEARQEPEHEIEDADIIEVSDNIPGTVQETMTNEAKETFSEMKTESRGFLGKLYEKIKSSDIVQNITDRYQIWKNDRLSQRAEKQMGGLEKQRADAMGKAGVLDDRRDKIGQEGIRVKGILEKMGKQIDPAVVEKGNKEIRFLEQRADAFRDQAKEIGARKDEMEKKFRDYKESVETARNQIDGRLAEKMKVNSESINTYTQHHEGLSKDIEANALEVSKLDEGIEALGKLLKENVDKVLRPTVEKEIKEAQVKKIELLKENKDLETAQKKVQSKIDILNGKNSDLRAKRDKIFPPTEKEADEAQAEKSPEEESQIKGVRLDVKAGEITLIYSQGEKAVMSGDKIITTFADGSERETAYDDIPDDQIEEIANNVPAEVLLKSKIPSEFIKRVEVARRPDVEQKKKFLVGDIIAAWNAKIPKESGFRVSLARGIDSKMNLEDQVKAKEFLLSMLARKVSGGKVDQLSAKVVSSVNKFFAERK